jgi:ATP-dependent DNA ligase
MFFAAVEGIVQRTTFRKAEFIEPMECALASTLPEGQEWTYEVKLDGYRAIGVRTSRETILYSPEPQELQQTIPADR